MANPIEALAMEGKKMCFGYVLLILSVTFFAGMSALILFRALAKKPENSKAKNST